MWHIPLIRSGSSLLSPRFSCCFSSWVVRAFPFVSDLSFYPRVSLPDVPVDPLTCLILLDPRKLPPSTAHRPVSRSASYSSARQSRSFTTNQRVDCLSTLVADVSRSRGLTSPALVTHLARLDYSLESLCGLVVVLPSFQSATFRSAA